jgi:hypothetical protein
LLLGGGGGSGGGGGGGSSHCTPTPFPVTFTTGFQSDNGYVIINFLSEPSSQPTRQPSSQPSNQPTGVPTAQPSNKPTNQPSVCPSRRPSVEPTGQPSGSPSVQPSNQPTSVPTRSPTCRPSVQPSSQPTRHPSRQPSSQPTRQPDSSPTAQPSSRPSSQPTEQPSGHPTRQPSSSPTSKPTTQPSSQPTLQPTVQPSRQPSNQPTSRPTSQPFASPSSQPTSRPSRQPSSQPSAQPSNHPSKQPNASPTVQPSAQPSLQPIGQPSSQPSGQPSTRPSGQPTGVPSYQPTNQPSRRPSSQPSSNPTTFPSSQPTMSPTGQPSSGPSGQPSSLPSLSPSSEPTNQPSSQPTRRPSGFPSAQPSSSPSNQPSERPSGQPSSQPSCYPSSQPTASPTRQPTGQPSNQPSEYPTIQPTSVPSTQPSNQPTKQPSGFPSVQPSGFPSSQPTVVPSSEPSDQPTSVPSIQPSRSPTVQPTSFPSNQPTCRPSIDPSSQPTDLPTSQPSNKPTNQPTTEPSSQPTVLPSSQPTSQPSSGPSGFPSCQPSTLPTNQPTGFPSIQPSNRPSNQPTGFPTNQPSNFPTSCPSRQPTDIPSCQPSVRPTNQPTVVPSNQPISLPTSQPTRRPSVQPVSSPSSRPSSQPISVPSIQPFAAPTSAPQATVYETNGVLFYLGVTSSTNKTVENNNNVLGSSFILFGRNLNHQSGFPSTISLDSSLSHVFVSPITSREAGIRSDPIIRSTTVVGDINDDGFLDLLVGYPLASKCSVYLGDGVNDFATIITTKGESFAIVGDPYQGGGFLGWSSIRVGDLNGDGIDEIMISAIYANTIYVIYGRTHFEKTINILDEMTNSKKGFQIQGSDQETNFGVGLTLVHHFRKGSHADIAVTAQRSSGGQCVVYILFGGVLFNEPIESVIAIDQIRNNPMVCLRILTPLYSFAGFSLAGIGDINSDGYDDLAIGSVPYYKGSYVEQRTYILFGRVFNASELELDLSEMGEKDGIIITGGGFLVTGVGDVNGDNVADVMISSYYDWEGQRSGYLISTPVNMTYSPSLQPSSSPTKMRSTVISNFSHFSNDRNSSSSSSSFAFRPSLRPSFVPSLFNSSSSSFSSSSTTRLPTRVEFAVGTSHPSAGKPSLAPSFSPTSGYHHLRGFPTMNPSLLRTRMPTMNATRVFTEIDCSSSSSQEKEYCRGNKNGTHSLFRITASAGIVKIIGNEAEGAKNVYVLYCPKENTDVIIENFRTSTDIISVIHLSKDGYSYSSLETIPYSVTSEQPLTLLFCSENRLQVILSSHTRFDLQEENFLFVPEDSTNRNHNSVHRRITFRNIMIVCGFLFFLAIGVYALSYQNNLEEKKRLEEEEKWLNPAVENGTVPVSPSFKRTKRIRRARNYKSVEGDSNNSISSSCTLVVAHQENEKNDELKLINESDNIGQEETMERNQQSTSLSFSTIPEMAKSFSRANISDDHISSIKSDEWENALAFSDDDKDDVFDQEDQSLQEKSISDEWKSALALSDDDICDNEALDDHGDQPTQEMSTTTVVALPLVLSTDDNNNNNNNHNNNHNINHSNNNNNNNKNNSDPVQIHDLHSEASSVSSWSSDEEYEELDDESLRLSSAELSSSDVNNRIYDDHQKTENSGRDVRNINSNEWEDAIVSSSEDER